MLLRFRATNHRSIRDTIELSMTTAGFSASRPADGDWRPVTNRVAGIFGANASGKTNILDALDFARRALQRSAHWDEFPRSPFLLDKTSKNDPSAYEIDFTIKDIRHTYGFEVSRSGVESEWLYSYPSGRKRVLFERGTPNDIEFGRNLKGDNRRIARVMGSHSLFLSVATHWKHKELGRIQHYLTSHFEYVPFSEQQQAGRIRSIRKWIEDDSVRRKAESLLRFADLGILRISAESKEIPEGQLDNIRHVYKALSTIISSAESPNSTGGSVDDFIAEQQKEIGFWHSTGDGSEYRLDISRESAGTVSWLSLALPALRAMEWGGVFAVDEIDASLHPKLVSAMIELFKTPEYNQTGAQLIFASHDTSLMSHLSGGALGREDVWFTEKDLNGATDLYPLTDFPVKSDHNIERRYLSGRYGSVPQISWQDFQRALEVGR
ncbi:ATP-binding protein [Kitasatospora sp. RB6PN24]|uniref:AAA family ATPase n=1 Tax=Kitasatospora humi TaxID=2893891 RepID=UPI001E52E8DC|nr:ATP-binding protein [Kitasatospora humi]MCC9311345.1 ATP-binding protein [Kitasatospora humi]